MRAIDLDFGPRTGSKASVLGWLLLMAGLLLAAGLLIEGTRQAQQQTALVARLALLEPADPALLARPGTTGHALLQHPGGVAELERIAARMRQPWNALFDRLEALHDNDIALLSLAPNATTRTVRFAAEARDLDAMLTFHRQLQQSAELRDVSLLNHQRMVDMRGNPVRFELLATWVADHAHP